MKGKKKKRNEFGFAICPTCGKKFKDIYSLPKHKCPLERSQKNILPEEEDKEIIDFENDDFEFDDIKMEEKIITGDLKTNSMDFFSNPAIQKALKLKEEDGYMEKVKMVYAFVFLWIIIVTPFEYLDETLKTFKLPGSNDMNLYKQIRNRYRTNCLRLNKDLVPPIFELPQNIRTVYDMFFLNNEESLHVHDRIKRVEIQKDDKFCPLDYSTSKLVKEKTLFPFLCCWWKWKRSSKFKLGIKVLKIIFPELLHLIEREWECILSLLGNDEKILLALQEEVKRWNESYIR